MILLNHISLELIEILKEMDIEQQLLVEKKLLFQFGEKFKIKKYH